MCEEIFYPNFLLAITFEPETLESQPRALNLEYSLVSNKNLS